MDLVTLLESVPPTVIGFIIGSVITVLGVVLTNAANTKRLRIQHDHDREMRSRERDLNLRKDIYLAAIEAISTGIVVISRFGDLNVSGQELMLAYTDRSPAIGKVSIVGTGETIKAVATFSQELTGAFLRLTALREGVQALQRRSEELEAEIEDVSRQQRQRAALMQELDPADPQEAGQLSALQQTHAVEEERLAALRAQLSGVSDQVFRSVMDLTEASLKEVATLDELVVPVITAMRLELGLPFDAALYAQIMEQSHTKQQEYLQRVMADLAEIHEPDEGEHPGSPMTGQELVCDPAIGQANDVTTSA